MVKNKQKTKVMFVMMRNPYSGAKGERVVVNNRRAYLEENLGQNVSFFVLRFFFQKKEKNLQYIDIGLLDLILGFFNYLFKGLPIQVALYSSKKIAKKVADLFYKGNFHSAHFFQARVFEVSRKIKKDKVVLEFIDALSLNYASRLREGSWFNRMAVFHELSRLKVFERSFDSIIMKVFVSSVDRDFLSLTNSIVIPNSIDIKQKLSQLPKDYDLVFSGNFNYGPNSESIKYFLSYIFPELRTSFPGVSIYLVGIGSEGFSNEEQGIYSSGKVNDIYKHIAKAKISIAPMVSGSGMQNKILEAFSVGVPAISTQIAYDPIASFAGVSKCLVCAESVEEWIQGVKRLLDLCNDGDIDKDVFLYAENFGVKKCHASFNKSG